MGLSDGYNNLLVSIKFIPLHFTTLIRVTLILHSSFTNLNVTLSTACFPLKHFVFLSFDNGHGFLHFTFLLDNTFHTHFCPSRTAFILFTTRSPDLHILTEIIDRLGHCRSHLILLNLNKTLTHFPFLSSLISRDRGRNPCLHSLPIVTLIFFDIFS